MIVWKSVPLTRCKSAYCRFRLWSRSLHGTTLDWTILLIHLRESSFPHPVLPPDQLFRLIFPRWDVIAIILSIFLLTYTYIEAKSNYYRGSILILRFVSCVWNMFSGLTLNMRYSYIVLTAGFYFAPPRPGNEELTHFTSGSEAWPTMSLPSSIYTTFLSLWSY